MTQSIDSIADAFFDALENTDIARLREIYAADVEIWHNTDNRLQPLEEHLNGLGQLARLHKQVRFEQRKRDIFIDGFVQQHLISITRHDGETRGVWGCIIGRIRDGRVARFDEYIDGAAAGAAVAP